MNSYFSIIIGTIFFFVIYTCILYYMLYLFVDNDVTGLWTYVVRCVWINTLWVEKASNNIMNLEQQSDKNFIEYNIVSLEGNFVKQF